MKSVPDYRRFLWIQNICLSIFFLGLSIGYVSSIYNQPFSHFLAQLIHSLYNGSFNLMPANKTGPFYSYEYYYATFLLTSICSLFSFLVWRKKISVSLSAFCRESVIISAFCLFFITASLQAIPFLYSNGRDIFKFSSMTQEEKYHLVGRTPYMYAQYVQEVTSEEYAAELYTDMDLAHDPGMFYQRQLAYYLYPIDIRGIRGEPKTHALFFHKNAFKDHLPDQTDLYHSYDNNFGVGSITTR